MMKNSRCNTLVFSEKHREISRRKSNFTGEKKVSTILPVHGVSRRNFCSVILFFPNITSFSYFLERLNPDFVPFFNSLFCITVPSNLCSPMSGLDNSAKTHYQPICWHCFGVVSQYLGIFYENQR